MRKPSQFLKDSEGGMMIMLAAGFFALAIAIGIVIDLSRAITIKTRLANALDAASLASAAQTDPQEAQKRITNLFNANFPTSTLEMRVDGPAAKFSEDKQKLALYAGVTFNTSFLRLIGKDTMTVSAMSEVSIGNKGLELALILDNSGAMNNGGKLDALRIAAARLVETIYGGKETSPYTWVSVVPYVASVNIGPAHSDFLTFPFTPNYSKPPLNTSGWAKYSPASWNVFMPTPWKGCVEERDYPLDVSDVPPFDITLSDGTKLPGASFRPYFWPDSSANDWYNPGISFNIDETPDSTLGPNKACGQELLPLTAEKSTVLATINDMKKGWSGGGTLANVGLAWGWRTLSPYYRDVWRTGSTPKTLPLDYNAPLTSKVAILVAGDNNQILNSHYSAYGINGELIQKTASQIQDEANKRLAETCQKMKENGIVLYTVLFSPTSKDTTQQMLKECASSVGNHFLAMDNLALNRALSQIAGQLVRIHISK